jgi:hypothetical protein
MQPLHTAKDTNLLKIYDRLHLMIEGSKYPDGKFISLEVSHDHFLDPLMLKLTFFCQRYDIYISPSVYGNHLMDFELIYYPPKVFLQKLQGRELTLDEQIDQGLIQFGDNLPRDVFIDSIFDCLTLLTYDEYLHAVHEAIWEIHNIK